MLDSPTRLSETGHHWCAELDRQRLNAEYDRAVAGLLGRRQRGAFQPVPVGGEAAPALLPALTIDGKVVRARDRSGRADPLPAGRGHPPGHHGDRQVADRRQDQ